MASLSNWALSPKLVLVSTGLLSLGVALKLSVPLVSDFIVSDVPNIWSFFLTWLRPPYLYILVNFIIISIAASSKFLNHKLDDLAHSPDPLVALPSDPVKMSGEVCQEYAVYNVANAAVSEANMISGDLLTNDSQYSASNYIISKGYVDDLRGREMALEVQQGRISNAEKMSIRDREIENEESVHAPSSVMTGLQSSDSLSFSSLNDDEKSPISARFGHRKAAKSSPQGGKAALGVAKPKRQDTLESTWRTMTEGRAMPLTRHLKKSDTMDSHLRRNATPLRDQNGWTPPPNSKMTKKSETFSEQSRACKENYSPASSSPGSAKMRKEASLSQDELNRRVEAFIRKFNQEMRLQRQESFKQYREMISRGTR
ncbi:hypothetical protein QN277_008701 [Acacia crassicarpa]|uniref:DUF4408 domain-containing protein n=1 Tax=Acacia crassicarpa TaxID=499986 RepID=A0AAE1M6X6_9FABA|nr:hypothetical protein QN277_008701 [Acacia crassicarpa]